MNSQRKIIQSNWLLGKKFIQRTVFEDLQIEKKYYVGREHLINDLSNTAYFQAKNNKGISNAGAVAGGVFFLILLATLAKPEVGVLLMFVFGGGFAIFFGFKEHQKGNKPEVKTPGYDNLGGSGAGFYTGGSKGFSSGITDSDYK